MLSSSESVFEKQESTVSASRVPTIRTGLDPRGAVERLSSRSPDQRIKLLLDD
jgi:hypothetical protein